MVYNKVSFEGVVKYNFCDVETNSAIRFESNTLYFRGVSIPIRKSLWNSFIGEFGYRHSINKTYHTIKFLITPDGGYMVKSYSGNKADNFIGKFMSIGMEDRWSSPQYGESEFRMPKEDEW